MMQRTDMTRRHFLELLGATGVVVVAAGLQGCTGTSSSSASTQASTSAGTASASTAAESATPGSFELNAAGWSYDADNDVYYQIGVQYCTSPQAPTYESMGIYVPGAYFDATANGDGTYTCTPSATGSVAGYTAATAPIVMPINTAGYSSQAAPTSYNAKNITSYLKAGFVYVYAGCRGRKMDDDACGAAPWGVTDLKAAVRTLRYNAAHLAGDAERIFSFGHSGGGAQSAVLGATGDAARYDGYLAAIGAPTVDEAGKALSDAIYGAMCWCPITCLTGADMAYEWNMGQFQSSGTRAEGAFTRQLSADLAAKYRDYVNALGLVDASGAALTLEEGGEGIATSGTYYDYVKEVIEKSLNDFLSDTTFPYTPSNSFNADMGAGGGGMSSGGAPSGSGPSASGAPLGSGPSGQAPSGSASRGSSSSAGSSASYDSPADYIAALNGDNAWIVYDEESNTASISGIAGFVAACKSASKAVGAFDAFDRSKAENEVFGDDDTQGLHFDAVMASLLEDNASAYASLSGWDSSYPAAWRDDRAKVDALGTSCDARQQMYDPLYFLAAGSEGAGTSTPCAHWRIRSGITQGDTALTTELNLALALAADHRVADVDFATVWGQGHTMAERTGSSTDNFIAWVNACCK